MRSIVILALAGLILSLLIIYQNPRHKPYTELLPVPPAPPFNHFIAGQGIIESAYKNIPIGSSYSDIITEIYVAVGDVVPRGANLFKTDTRYFESQLREALEEQNIAQQEYNKQRIQFNFYKNLSNKNAVSKLTYTAAEYAQKIAYQQLQKAKASVQTHKASIERSYIKAPIDGQVLQLNICVGQYAYQTTERETPLILFGDTNYFHVRVDIDEEDAWRYITHTPAIAYVRGNKKIEIMLEYVYIEPYIVPKRSLTGSDMERVDTRVLQVVYRFKKHDLPVFMGQLLDVYIKAQPHTAYVASYEHAI